MVQGTISQWHMNTVVAIHYARHPHTVCLHHLCDMETTGHNDLWPPGVCDLCFGFTTEYCIANGGACSDMVSDVDPDDEYVFQSSAVTTSIMPVDFAQWVCDYRHSLLTRISMYHSIHDWRDSSRSTAPHHLSVPHTMNPLPILRQVSATLRDEVTEEAMEVGVSVSMLLQQYTLGISFSQCTPRAALPEHSPSLNFDTTNAANTLPAARNAISMARIIIDDFRNTNDGSFECEGNVREQL